MIFLLIYLTGYAQRIVPKNVNSCYCEPPNCYIILPSQTENPTTLERLKKYISNTINGIIIADTTALRMDLSRYDLYAYGSLKSNLWLKKYTSEFPIRIYDDRIETDTIIQGNDLIATIAWNNPINKSKDVTLYIAQKTESLIGVHGTFQGWKQIHISRNRELIHSQSYRYYGSEIEYSEHPIIPDKRKLQLQALSKKQMYDDFDSLREVILKVLPIKTINESIYQIDISEKLIEFRREIDSIQTFDGFIDLTNRTINFSRGSHFWITNVFKYKGYYSDFKNQKTLFSIPLFYHEGEYFTKHTFEYKHRTFKPGLKVVSVNGKTPDHILDQYKDRVRLLNWDYERKKNYKSDFYNLLSTDSLEIIFAGKGQKMKAIFKKEKKPIFSERVWEVRKEIRYFTENRLLYIGLPEMNDSFLSFYKTELQKLNLNSSKVDAIIIDIRGNPGGGDPAWEGLLSYLIEKPIHNQLRLAVKNTSKNMSLLSDRKSWIINNHNKKENISFSNNESFVVIDLSSKIDPAINSLKLNAPIYIISQNVYSSGGSFMNLANYSNQLYSVGMNNPLILGFGVSPFYFMLKNSTIEFILVPTVDISHSKNPVDTHHVHVEIPVDLTLEEWIHYYNTIEEGNEAAFLLKKDPFVKKILEFHKNRSK